MSSGLLPEKLTNVGCCFWAPQIFRLYRDTTESEMKLKQTAAKKY